MIEKTIEKLDANPDPITGAPGAHPVGTAIGATGAALAGVVLSTVVVIAGQADLIQKLTAQQLGPAQIAEIRSHLGGDGSGSNVWVRSNR